MSWTGIFKIEDSAHVAKLWGIRKNRPAMNYDKLSRSIRQYYKKGIIKKPDVSQRLVYQFVHPVWWMKIPNHCYSVPSLTVNCAKRAHPYIVMLNDYILWVATTFLLLHVQHKQKTVSQRSWQACWDTTLSVSEVEAFQNCLFICISCLHFYFILFLGYFIRI